MGVVLIGKKGKGIGIARSLCNPKAKPAIKTEESVMRKQHSVKLSLFCFL